LNYEFIYGSIATCLDHKDILIDIYRLRYQVYVNEWGFESADDYPDGLEYDDFDRYSIHTYVCSVQEKHVVGTVRTILNSHLGFPVEKYFEIPQLPVDVDRNNTGEISRLAISKKYRRRIIDNAIFGESQNAARRIPRFIDNGRDYRRHCEHELVRGLYISLYQQSKLRGLTHWYAVMAPGLYVILRRWGIVFKQIGPPRDYHGLRAPYLISIESMERSLSQCNPVLYSEAQKGMIHLEQSVTSLPKLA